MALRSGIPSLVIPFAYDQPDNAERLRRLGVALTMPRKRITSRNLAEHLGRILHDAPMQSRARTLAAQIKPEEEMSRTIHALEEFAQTA